MADPPSIDAAMCERLIGAAYQSCPKADLVAAPIAAAVPPGAAPNWDAMAASFASLSVGLTVGSIVIAVVSLLAALGWGYVVTIRAEREAREEAKRCAQLVVDKWLAEVAPQIVSKHMENIQDASLGDLNDIQAADDIGKEA